VHVDLDPSGENRPPSRPSTAATGF
jgi:hypothetical protein